MISNFIPKDYPQIFESLRLQLTGGKTQQFLYVPTYVKYTLAEEGIKKEAIVAVQGIREGKACSFTIEQDYQIVGQTAAATDPPGVSITWKPNRNPDHGTWFVVFYYGNAPSPLTDMNVGSVARTICEAFSFELAFLYGQMKYFYDSAFLDTATGPQLDRLAELFQLPRIGGGDIYLLGEVIFEREAGSQGQIVIEAGTLLQTRLGESFVSTKATQLQGNQKESPLVTIRSQKKQEDFKKAREKAEQMHDKQDRIELMPSPINGIAKVRQHDRFYPSSKLVEDDASLRDRCRKVLGGMGKCTRQAIQYELMSKGVEEVNVYTPEIHPQEVSLKPGEILVVAYSSRQNMPEFGALVERHFRDVKAAGVIGKLKWAEPISYDLEIVPALAEEYSYCEIEVLDRLEKALVDNIQTLVKDYFSRLRLGQTPSPEKIKALVMGCDPCIASATIHLQRKSKSNEKAPLPQSDTVEGETGTTEGERKLKFDEKPLLQEYRVKPYNRIKVVLYMERIEPINPDVAIRAEGFWNHLRIEKLPLARKILSCITNTSIALDKLKELIAHEVNAISNLYDIKPAQYKKATLESRANKIKWEWQTLDANATISIEKPFHLTIEIKSSSETNSQPKEATNGF